MNLPRREFIKLSVLTSSAMMLPQWPLKAGASKFLQEQVGSEPHFFIQYMFGGGLDCSYLFDARPMSMTSANLLANYLKEDPQVWRGSVSGQTLATKLVDPLKAYEKDFSILNGVMMASGFDGHDQNAKYIYAGNPFGGDAYIPILNYQDKAFPLDGVSSGLVTKSLKNLGTTVPLTADTAKSLIRGLKNSPPLTTESRDLRFAMSRLIENARGSGRFSEGSQKMASALSDSPQLVNRIRDIEIPESKEFLPIVGELFKRKIAKSIMIEDYGTNDTLDVHAPEDCKKMPEKAAKRVEKIGQLISFLKSTPFDEKRSLFDVTTFVVTSEFSRSMRQNNRKIDDTGTDHNPLNNSVLIGGKGIRGGMVVGGSDFQTSDEALSGAHLELDPEKIKFMGRPFDHSSLTVREDKPEKYSPKDYLFFSSIVNTVLDLYGVPSSYLRTIDRAGNVAPLLKGLLV